MNIEPLGNRVVVKRLDAEAVSAGGIVLPESAKEQEARGTVLAAGRGKCRDNGDLVPMQVKVGDVVIFGKYAGTEIKLDGETYMIMSEDDIIAKTA